jgi:hypothetical protein
VWTPDFMWSQRLADAVAAYAATAGVRPQSSRRRTGLKRAGAVAMVVEPPHASRWRPLCEATCSSSRWPFRSWRPLPPHPRAPAWRVDVSIPRDRCQGSRLGLSPHPGLAREHTGHVQPDGKTTGQPRPASLSTADTAPWGHCPAASRRGEGSLGQPPCPPGRCPPSVHVPTR